MIQVHEVTLIAALQTAMLDLAKRQPDLQIGANADLLGRVCRETVQRCDGNSLIASTARAAVDASLGTADSPPWDEGPLDRDHTSRLSPARILQR